MAWEKKTDFEPWDSLSLLKKFRKKYLVTLNVALKGYIIANLKLLNLLIWVENKF